MNRIWTDEAWEDYVYWQENDRKTLKRINILIKDIARNGYNVRIGKPEPLRGNLTGWWSVHIDEKHRIVFKISDGCVVFSQCGNHYDDK